VFVAKVFEGDDAPKNGKDNPAYPYDVQTFEDQGRDHVPPGVTVDTYNSNPPTSGPHGPVAPWGVSDVPIPKESAVHNMEHGGVVIWYNCDPQIAPTASRPFCTLPDQLAELVQPLVDDGMFILLTPYGGMTEPIALTAWQNLAALDGFDEAKIRAFIASFECKFNPERFCD